MLPFLVGSSKLAWCFCSARAGDGSGHNPRILRTNPALSRANRDQERLSSRNRRGPFCWKQLAVWLGTKRRCRFSSIGHISSEAIQMTPGQLFFMSKTNRVFVVLGRVNVVWMSDVEFAVFRTKSGWKWPGGVAAKDTGRPPGSGRVSMRTAITLARTCGEIFGRSETCFQFWDERGKNSWKTESNTGETSCKNHWHQQNFELQKCVIYRSTACPQTWVTVGGLIALNKPSNKQQNNDKWMDCLSGWSRFETAWGDSWCGHVTPLWQTGETRTGWLDVVAGSRLIGHRSTAWPRPSMDS